MLFGIFPKIPMFDSTAPGYLAFKETIGGDNFELEVAYSGPRTFFGRYVSARHVHGSAGY